MRKALFVDHSFHRKTRSTDFFIEILSNRFLVDVYYVEPAGRPDERLLAAVADVDVVVLWQMDFLAPVILAVGKPVVVVPMFDGSGGMPDIHWLFAKKARFLNFSMVLNERIRMAGCETMLLRYFPEPVEEEKLPKFDQLHGFFWQRRPDHGIDVNTVDVLLGQQLNSLHVHNAPDVKGLSSPTKPINPNYAYSESSWSNDNVEYKRQLRKANVFIAPRVAEGIGMALLEAMAEGKVVFAHDAPTNSEYVSNWCNGILFNKNNPGPVEFRERAAQISLMAWRTVVEGRKQWLGSHAAILDWIDQAQPSTRIEIDHAGLFVELWRSYYSSLSAYTSFLNRNLGLLSQLVDLPLEELLAVVGHSASPHSEASRTSLGIRSIAGDGTLDLTRHEACIGGGWSAAEPDWRWALGKRSELYFSGVANSGSRMEAIFTASALPELGESVGCSIVLNDQFLQDLVIRPGWSDYGVIFEASLLRDENILVLYFDKSTTIPSDSRDLSVCFKSFRFRSV